ncbi:hypothetical protein BS50DRAFT_567293 [Corynespora cassiicola Philippines]|uniref:Uncharacterized protein n=1 Tax=Corynespora cassiicola Philippines TaxID=1448308 RepID=A0A2T2P9X1_CORCC|nr:hypothetical protein BS50DRAFT_567293 [Corynespora cassiicola Philippines]
MRSVGLVSLFFLALLCLAFPLPILHIRTSALALPHTPHIKGAARAESADKSRIQFETQRSDGKAVGASSGDMSRPRMRQDHQMTEGKKKKRLSRSACRVRPLSLFPRLATGKRETLVDKG